MTTLNREQKPSAFSTWLTVWILFSTWSSISGWCLSIVHSLNTVGTLVSYVIFFGALIFFYHDLRNLNYLPSAQILRSRFWAPKLWLALAVLSVLGGLFYSPNNYDYLNYRFTRVLNWSWEQTWYWVPTVNDRINYSGTGFEWLMAPLFIVFKTDRLFFLINYISYLFLPALIFSVFSNLGISKRICWWWMWVLPCGYCFILQAASAGNDSFATVYFLASLYYLFQARDSSQGRHLVLSCLAIALMTGAKTSDLPLVLPWLIAFFFNGRFFYKSGNYISMVAVVIVSAFVSFLPIALINVHFTGDYTGDPMNVGKMKLSNPVVATIGNALQLAKDNFAPPILPHAVDCGAILPSSLKTTLHEDFPRIILTAGELQTEESAGVGLGAVLFAALFMIVGIGSRIAAPVNVISRNPQAVWILCSAVIATAAYMSKMGSEAASRLVAPYYPGVIAALLLFASLDGRVMRITTFRAMAFIAMISAFPLVILSPSRPLFPVQLVGQALAGSHVSPALTTRYHAVYGVYASRSNPFQDLTALVPTDERTIGLLPSGNSPVAPLWKPFGSRRIVEVTAQNSPSEITGKGIRYILVSNSALVDSEHTDEATLLSTWSADLVGQKDIVLMARNGPERWYVVRLR